MPRILLASLFHETHSFVDDTTGRSDFTRQFDAELTARRGDGSQLDGFLEMAEQAGWEVVPTAAYIAMPSGAVEDSVFEEFWEAVRLRALAAIEDGLDAVFLSLHGAMTTETLEDAEGEFLARLRALDGFETLPIFGSFDLHATFTRRMAELATALVGYRENPHTDAFDTANHAAALLRRTLETGERPHMRMATAPIVWSPLGTGTADSPMRELEAMARQIESDYPDIWAVNVIAGYAYSDAEEAGVSFSVVTAGDDASADQALRQLVALAINLREAGLAREIPVDEALEQVAGMPPGPVLLVESADNIGGGSPGDCTGVLRALLRHDAGKSCVIINDPEAVEALADCEPGDTRTLPIGGKGSRFDEGPVALNVTFVSRSDGKFELENAHSHLASIMGRWIDMGDTAVVTHSDITIVLTSLKTPPMDLGQLRSQNVEPTDYRVIGIKAAVAHRQAYNPIAAASWNVTTPGPCPADPRVLPYKRLRRPIFPLDPIGPA